MSWAPVSVNIPKYLFAFVIILISVIPAPLSEEISNLRILFLLENNGAQMSQKPLSLREVFLRRCLQKISIKTRQWGTKIEKHKFKANIDNKYKHQESAWCLCTKASRVGVAGNAQILLRVTRKYCTILDKYYYGSRTSSKAPSTFVLANLKFPFWFSSFV